MRRPGIHQERIASCLGILQQTISKHLQHLAMSPNVVNTDLKRGFTVAQVAEKHGWPEPLVWSIVLEGQEDLKRFKVLNWELRIWDLLSWNECDKRFGDDWLGRIPAQMIAHILYYFSDQGDLVFDPIIGVPLDKFSWCWHHSDLPNVLSTGG